MTEQGDWVSTLRGLIQKMVASETTELEVSRGDLRVRLRRVLQPQGAQPTKRDPVETAAPDRAELHRVAVPLTGIFYTTPNPSSRSFVEVGDWVEPDTVVGLIEAMKVFNEVTADCRGRVAAILAQQGQLVHVGEPIVLVDTAAAPDHANEVQDE